MPKRRHEENKEEKWKRKMKKYQQKLTKERAEKSRRIIYSSEEEDDVQIEEHHETGSFLNPEYSEVGNMLPESAEQEPELIENSLPGPNIEPDLEAVTDVIDPDIDTEMLKVLGDLETNDTEWGDDVQSDIAKRIQLIITSGLKKETKEDLSKKYPFPKNIPFLKAPVLNPEVHTMLNESSRNRDKRLNSKQEQHGRALTALSKAMTILLKKNPDIPEALRILNDALKLMSDSHYLETDTRKSLILGFIDKSLIDSFRDRKRDEFLFGEKLGDLVKTSRGIKKTGQLIQAPPTTSLNWKGPPSARSRPQRSNQQQASRTGGYQAQYASRRRVLQPPAPALARRQTAPPPPPPAAPRRQPPAYAPPQQYSTRRFPPPPPRTT